MEPLSDNVITNPSPPQLRKERGYFCSQCNQCFETATLLRKHYRSHTDLPFKCYVCGQGFADFRSRREHILQHRAERRLKCSDCGRSFDDIPAIDSHRCRGSVIEPKHFQCDQCGKTFGRKDILENHLPTHSKVKQFSCDLCDKGYTQRTALIRHKKVHSTSRDLTCRCHVCGKLMSCDTALRDHLRTHTGEKPFKCKECGKRFAQRSTLAGHVKTHAKHKEKPFKCNDCGKSFFRVGDFHIHQRIHTGEKPYKCDLCEKSFPLSSSLSKHKVVHIPLEMRVEKAAKEGKLYKCGYCDKVFITNSHFRRHERTHTKEKPHRCTDCNKSFSRSDDLTSHRSSVHGFRETHECWVRGKFLSSYSKLELHICLHTGERPHSCPMCMKGYLSLKGLKKHIRSHKNGTKLIEIGNI